MEEFILSKILKWLFETHFINYYYTLINRKNIFNIFFHFETIKNFL